MTGLEVLNSELNLPDQWQLGSGGRVVWAPAKPVFLNQPGFRDPGTFDGFSISPVFAITLLDQKGRQIPIEAVERTWTPAKLELKYRIPQALITERRTTLSTETLLSEWTMSHSASTAQHFWLVLWTRRPHQYAGRCLADIEANPQGISFLETALDETGEELARWGYALGASFDADSWSVNSTANRDDSLAWEDTPFYELMTTGGLPGHVPANENTAGQMYCALAYPFEIPPGERLVVTFAASFGCDVEHARRNLERSVSMIHPIQASEEEWINWFEDVPTFTCSDPYLEKLYWYRWSLRRLWSTAAGHEEESIGTPEHFSGTPNFYSAGILEDLWHHAPEIAWDELRTLLNHSAGELATVPVAHAIKRLQCHHPDAEMLRGVRLQLRELAETFDDEHTRPVKGMPVEPWECPESQIRSLRTTVFRLQVFQLLAALDQVPGDNGWQQAADQNRDRLQHEFWCDKLGFFIQPHPDRPARPVLRTVDGFLPLIADAVTPQQREALLQRLFDPECFWTRFPLPSLCRDDVDFNAEGHWQGQRCMAPRHGRIWLDDCSLVIDALGHGIENESPQQRVLFAELVRSILKIAFIEGDLNRPAFFPHYNPLNGKPAAFLGRDCRAGGWFIDHILRYVAGIRVADDGTLTIDPLPFNLEWFSVRNVIIGDHELEVEWDQRTGLTVRMDDEPAGRAGIGRSLSISFPQPWALRGA